MITSNPDLSFPMIGTLLGTAQFPPGPLSADGMSFSASADLNSDDWMYALIDSGSNKHYLCPKGRTYFT